MTVVAGTVLFANPSAQSGKAEELIADARRLLDQAGIEHEFIATLPDSGTIGLVRRAIDEDGARRIIYMGGDGTFADVAKGILAAKHARDVAMGMLPTGTANDQGKSFGLRTGPAGFADNVKVIAAGMTTEIDVGRIELLDAGDQTARSDLFFDSASIGWGAAVLRTRNVDREAVAGIPVVRQIYSDYLVYAKAMVQHLLGQALPGRKFDMEVVVDGQPHRYESLMDVVFKNTHVFAGEWVLSADAEADDGLFEMVPIAGVADFTGKILTTFRHNPIDEEDFRKLGIVQSEAVRGQCFDVTILQPGAEVGLPVQIDGEEFPPGDRFRISVLRRVLRLIVPRAEAR
jgi:diacylglycerol kinase family enzyme